VRAASTEGATPVSLAEHCYRDGCDRWVTGASDYCSEACETEARQVYRAIGRIGEHAEQMTAATSAMHEAVRAAVQAYDAYLDKLYEGLNTGKVELPDGASIDWTAPR
jgi:hypothetical protein